MLPGSPGIAEPHVLTMCSYNFVLRSLPVLAISGNDICSHRHQEPGCVWRMAKKPAKTSARGLDLHGTLGKAGGPGAAPEHVFKVTHWPRLPPPFHHPHPSFEHIRQGKSTCVLHKDKYGISAPRGEPASPAGGADRTRWCQACPRSRLRSVSASGRSAAFVYCLLSPAPYLALHARLMGPSRHQPHSVAALQAPCSPPPPPISLRASGQAPPHPAPTAAADSLEEAGLGGGELVTDTHLASVLRNGRAPVTHLRHGSR